MKRKIVITLGIGFLSLLLLRVLIIKAIEDPVFAGLPKCEYAECYYSEGFRDYADYCKYYFLQESNIAEWLKESKYFKPATDDYIEEIKSYFEDFEGWVEFEDYKEHYDFKCEWIDTADYFYIESKDEFNKYESYNVYFFDVQTSVLYFIHSNI